MDSMPLHLLLSIPRLEINLNVSFKVCFFMTLLSSSLQEKGWLLPHGCSQLLPRGRDRLSGAQDEQELVQEQREPNIMRRSYLSRQAQLSQSAFHYSPMALSFGSQPKDRKSIFLEVALIGAPAWSKWRTAASVWRNSWLNVLFTGGIIRATDPGYAGDW